MTSPKENVEETAEGQEDLVVEETSQEPSEDTSSETEESEIDERPVNEFSVGLSEGTEPEFKWYVAHVLTGQENKVARTLRERILNHDQANMFSEILLPEEAVTTSVRGKKRTLKKKFFPGYLILKMIMNDSTWHLVKDTDKITGFIGADRNRPTPITEQEAAELTNQSVTGLRKSRTSINISEGDSVKVIEGPFASFVGSVEEVNDKGKLKVNVSIFGRPTPVELDHTQVEKA